MNQYPQKEFDHGTISFLAISATSRDLVTLAKALKLERPEKFRAPEPPSSKRHLGPLLLASTALTAASSPEVSEVGLRHLLTQGRRCAGALLERNQREHRLFGAPQSPCVEKHWWNNLSDFPWNNVFAHPLLAVHVRRFCGDFTETHGRVFFVQGTLSW